MNLHQKIKNCQRCSLHQNMPDGCQPVPGIGPVNAKLFLVGEALGEQESILEKPFVGRAGQLLTVMLENAGIDRDEVYISNVVKCRPTTNNGKKNRPPETQEILACKIWLWKELTEIQPRVIITLGGVSSKLLLKVKPSVTMKSIVGEFHKTDYIQSEIMPCYHPSYLLQHGRDKLEFSVQCLQNAKERCNES